MTSQEVVSLLIEAFKTRRVPKHIRSDNRGELIARTTDTPPSAHIAAQAATRRDGAVLCIGSCRDLPVTRSIIAKASILAREPLWHAQKRSLRVSAALGRLFVPVD